MKKLIKIKTIILTMLLSLTLSLSYEGCSKHKDMDSAGDKTRSENMTEEHHEDKKENGTGNSQEVINIPSAQCNRCKSKITKTLKKLDGITSYDIDIDNHVVNVNYDKTMTSLNKIEEAISLAGYDANSLKADPEAYSKLDNCCKKPDDR